MYDWRGQHLFVFCDLKTPFLSTLIGIKTSINSEDDYSITQRLCRQYSQIGHENDNNKTRQQWTFCNKGNLYVLYF
jgi:hypothetical protein